MLLPGKLQKSGPVKCFFLVIPLLYPKCPTKGRQFTSGPGIVNFRSYSLKNACNHLLQKLGKKMGAINLMCCIYRIVGH